MGKTSQCNELFDNPKPGRVYDHRAAWLAFDSSTAALLIMLAVYALGFTDLGRNALKGLTTTKTQAAELEPPSRGAVLVLGANPRDQRAIRLTVSPRGYLPIFVNSGEQALARLAEHNASFQVAVVDQGAPGAAEALETIRHVLPLHRVISLSGPTPPADLARLLLDVL